MIKMKEKLDKYNKAIVTGGAGFKTEQFIQLPLNMHIFNYHLLFSHSIKTAYLFLYNILIFLLLPLTLLKYWRERKTWAIFISAGFFCSFDA